MQTYYAQVAPGVIFSSAAPPPGPNPYQFEWTTSTPPNSEVAHFSDEAFEARAKVYLTELADSRNKFNTAQQAFKFAQLLSSSRRDKTTNHTGTYYVQQAFAPYTAFRLNIGEQDLVRSLSSTLAHEVGHGLGLQHTGIAVTKSLVASENVIAQSEQQVITVTPGFSKFNISFGGSTTSDISFDASSLDVAKQLGALPGLRGKDISVAGANGGPYTVEFGHFGDNGLVLVLGIDAPPLTGANISVVESQRAIFSPQKWVEVNIEGTLGRNDLMLRTTDINSRTFLPKISEVWLRMALGVNWGTEEARLQAKILPEIVRNNAERGPFAPTPPVSPISPPGEEPVSDLDDFGYDGPGLVVAVEGAGFDGTAALDFGVAAPGLPATKRISLVNFGGEPAVIRSIGVTSGIARFSTPTLPVTTLQPGETFEFDVTFVSELGFESIGRLVIDSDINPINLLDGSIELRGSGGGADTPAIGLPFYNNFGGAIVGELTGFGGLNRNQLLTNNGTAPLVITEIRVAAGQGAGE